MAQLWSRSHYRQLVISVLPSSRLKGPPCSILCQRNEINSRLETVPPPTYKGLKERGNPSNRARSEKDLWTPMSTPMLRYFSFLQNIYLLGFSNLLRTQGSRGKSLMSTVWAKQPIVNRRWVFRKKSLWRPRSFQPPLYAVCLGKRWRWGRGEHFQMEKVGQRRWSLSLWGRFTHSWWHFFLPGDFFLTLKVLSSLTSNFPA